MEIRDRCPRRKTFSRPRDSAGAPDLAPAQPNHASGNCTGRGPLLLGPATTTRPKAGACNAPAPLLLPAPLQPAWRNWQTRRTQIGSRKGVWVRSPPPAFPPSFFWKRGARSRSNTTPARRPSALFVDAMHGALREACFRLVHRHSHEHALAQTSLRRPTRRTRKAPAPSRSARRFSAIRTASFFRRPFGACRTRRRSFRSRIMTTCARGSPTVSRSRAWGVRSGRSSARRSASAMISRISMRSDFGAIVSAAALAHDLGNPPLGHSGEDAIRVWFESSTVAAGKARRRARVRAGGSSRGSRAMRRASGSSPVCKCRTIPGCGSPARRSEHLRNIPSSRWCRTRPRFTRARARRSLAFSRASAKPSPKWRTAAG